MNRAHAGTGFAPPREWRRVHAWLLARPGHAAWPKNKTHRTNPDPPRAHRLPGERMAGLRGTHVRMASQCLKRRERSGTCRPREPRGSHQNGQPVDERSASRASPRRARRFGITASAPSARGALSLPSCGRCCPRCWTRRRSKSSRLRSELARDRGGQCRLRARGGPGASAPRHLRGRHSLARFVAAAVAGRTAVGGHAPAAHGRTASCRRAHPATMGLPDHALHGPLNDFFEALEAILLVLVVILGPWRARRRRAAVAANRVLGRDVRGCGLEDLHTAREADVPLAELHALVEAQAGQKPLPTLLADGRHRLVHDLAAVEAGGGEPV
mmetsp:Transcript_89165/g.257053  ORF Transcript_89165/g.257053 Transcript_89165/m.257053 type:complete len:328 (-) Transcript_89165:18-1001(-)